MTLDLRIRGWGKRLPIPPRPTVAQLDAMAAGDKALAECSYIHVRLVWTDQGADASCPLCRRRVLHTNQTHYALMAAKVRRLPRGYPSKVRLAERAYRAATGIREPMEKTLWREVVTNRRTCRELAEVLGVCFKTIARWCQRIGIQDLEDEGASRRNEFNEFERGFRR